MFYIHWEWSNELRENPWRDDVMWCESIDRIRNVFFYFKRKLQNSSIYAWAVMEETLEQSVISSFSAAATSTPRGGKQK